MTQLAPKRRTLVETVSEDLRGKITAGAYKVGERLPSEARLTEAYSVSRTVVREAIAALKSDGLVEPQKGAGVFVIEPRPENVVPFSNIDTDRLSSMLELLELRTAIEIEAAALAAQRRSPAQEEKIIEALRKVNSGDSVSPEDDFALHLAIAEATGNPRFAEILQMLGTAMIPRKILNNEPAKLAPEYIDMLHQEHEEIVSAVLDGDEDRASRAMRHHLNGSQKRYRQFLRG